MFYEFFLESLEKESGDRKDVGRNGCEEGEEVQEKKCGEKWRDDGKFWRDVGFCQAVVCWDSYSGYRVETKVTIRNQPRGIGYNVVTKYIIIQIMVYFARVFHSLWITCG